MQIQHLWLRRTQSSYKLEEVANKQKYIHDGTLNEVKDSKFTFSLLLADTHEIFWQKPHFFLVLVLKDANLMFRDMPFTKELKKFCGRCTRFNYTDITIVLGCNLYFCFLLKYIGNHR